MHLVPARFVALLAAVVVLSSCSSNSNGGGNTPPPPPPPPPTQSVLKRPSKSGAIAITGDDHWVLQVNPESGSLSIFDATSDTKTAELSVGGAPSSVVVAPDDQSAYVALRSDAKVVRVAGIQSSSPHLDGAVEVGSEPTGIALSPLGAKLVVAEFAESRISLVDTATMTVTRTAVVRNPRAVAVTNNGDSNDGDERVLVTEFYGRLGPGEDATDGSRTGAVAVFGLTDLAPVGTALFAPQSPGAFVPTLTSPNQLASIAIAGDTFFATAVGASPDGAATFNENVFPLLLVGKVSTATATGVVSLADAIKAQVPDGSRNFLADLHDVALIGENLVYVVAQGGDAVQRIIPLSGNAVTLGTQTVKQIDLLGGGIGCQNPIGLVTPHDTTDTKKMYVNCWVSRTAAVVDLSQQKAVKSVPATAPPSGDDAKVNQGRRFYFTGRGRWSKDTWSSCGSCHPDGLSDNVTWRFASGPRQTTSMDGTFSHGVGAQTQRILNWTAINDEIHDFERNTRGVSGGLGALTTGACAKDHNGDLTGEQRIALSADPTDPNGLKTQLGKPVKEIQDETPSCQTDWDAIEAFVKTIRPSRGRRGLDAQAVVRGRALFDTGGCASCHGGPGWTISRRFYQPSADVNARLANLPFSAAGSPHLKQIEAEPTSAGPVAPAQVACVLRNVTSFGVPGNAQSLVSLERKPDGTVSQGAAAGFSVPSLYGLQMAEPLLHHGQAKTMEELLGDPVWTPHLVSGNPVFAPNVAQRADLAAFLFSIDATTPEFDFPSASDLCPGAF